MIDIDRFKVYALDANEFRVGQIDDYRSLKAKILHNDVGTWTLEIDRSSNWLLPLTTPGCGLDIYDHKIGKSFARGLIDTTQQKYDAETDTLTITGWDDNQWLNWRLAHPSPAEAPGSSTYTAQAYDVRTGTLSSILCQYADVNLGASAIGPRLLTLTPSVDANVGSVLTGRARWEVLLTFMQDLAQQSSVPVGFRMGRLNNAKRFETYAPVDRSDIVKFSVGLGNLVGGNIKVTSPKATYVFAAGSGDLTARVYRETWDSNAIATYGRREYFYDVNNTSDAGELLAAGQKALLDQGKTAEFALQISDTGSLIYGVDYRLSDKVTGIFVGDEASPIVGLPDGSIQEMITSVELSMDGEDYRITPTMGTPSLNKILKTFDEIRRLRAQLLKRQNN